MTKKKTSKKSVSSKKGYVLGVISAKGGVGKTVTSANLAVAFSIDLNKRVVAIDTNVTTASLGFHFNILYPEASIYDIIKKDFSFHWAVHHFNDNLDIIPASIAIDKRDKNIHKMQDNIKKVVQHYTRLLKDLTKEYDYVILDAAGGFNLESIATMTVSDGILLVTNPEYPAVVAAAKCVSYCKMLKVPIIGIILAKVKGKGFEISKEKIEESLGVPVIGSIPEDENVPKSISRKVPILLYKPFSKASIAYRKVAAAAIGMEYKPKISEKIKSWFT